MMADDMADKMGGAVDSASAHMEKLVAKAMEKAMENEPDHKTDGKEQATLSNLAPYLRKLEALTRLKIGIAEALDEERDTMTTLTTNILADSIDRIINDEIECVERNVNDRFGIDA